MKRPPLSPEVALVVAIVGISFAAPLVRLSSAHPLAIAFWRLGFSLAFVAAALVLTGAWRELRQLSLHEAMIGAAAGVMLALHFWTWNASVKLTTIAASTVLVDMQPAIVAVLSAILLKERPRFVQVAGILVALIGAFVVTSPSLFSSAESGGSNPALGNSLALAGAFAAAIYYLGGRRLRTGLSLWPYAALVYGACFLALGVMAAVTGVSLSPQPQREILIFLALAIGPMLLGHTAMNYALRYRPAYVVNITVLGEPVGATVLGAILPGIRELPPVSTIIGGAIIVAGVLLTVVGERRGD